MRARNYFELKRGLTYLCNLDKVDFSGKWEYKLHKHYLVYRKIGVEMDHDTGKYVKPKWRPVWNVNYYDDTKACYILRGKG